MNWDEYYINILAVVRSKSKDPSTQNGALIIGEDNEIISTGYNGFPRGIDEEDPTRWVSPEPKYKYVEHAERNAIYNAARIGVQLKGTTLYLVGFGPPTVPCIDCSKAIIQVGIQLVKGHAYKPADPSWLSNLNFSYELLKEAGVKYEEI